MADRRSRILAVAARRFAAAGFDATTVRQIADDVDLLSGSLYHHFDTKEAMLHAIVRAPVLRRRDLATRIAALPVDAEQRLVTLIDAELRELTASHEVHAILYNERKFFRRNPDFAYVAAAKKEELLAWQAVFADGARHGLFAGDGNHLFLIASIIRLLSTGADWFMAEDGDLLSFMGAPSLAELTRMHLAFILRGVRAPERAWLPIPEPVAMEP